MHSSIAFFVSRHAAGWCWEGVGSADLTVPHRAAIRYCIRQVVGGLC